MDFNYDYDTSCGDDDNVILGKTQTKGANFVSAGRTFLQMQRPSFDADALIGKMARCGIHAIRKAAAKHAKRSYRPNRT